MLPVEFHFLRPWWLLALVPLALLVWQWIIRTQGESGWKSAIDQRLLEVLLDNSHRGSNNGLRAALMLAMLALTIGLAGPTWHKLPQPVEQKNDALVILLDLSLSMLAEDVKPSRVERARQKVTDILRLRDEGLTALVAYAGDAHAVVPLTDDVATIENLLGALGPEMMPVPGSNPGHALELARDLLDNSVLQQGRILMITDGIDAINSVSRHRNPAFPISIIGIGTEQGGPIPLDRLRQPGKVLRTQEGNRVIALLDHQRLQDVADLTYGRYAPAVIGDNDILQALSTPLPSEDDTLEVEREFDSWYDQGHWLVVLALPVFLWFFRKGVVISVPLAAGAAAAVLLLQAPPAMAVTAADLSDAWSSLWRNNNQRGHQALRYGEPEKAAALFDDPLWRSAAEYRSGNYAAALQGYAADGSATGHYNQGNSLARLGNYQAAIDRYNKVLAEQPDHEDAAFNKALLEKLLEEQQDAQQDDQHNQQSQANNEQSEAEQDNQQQQQDPSEQDQQSEQSEEQQQAENEQQQQQQQADQQQQAQAEQDEATRDEKQEALEQWLRRVPDDPGGLLRRKFTHETKQRLRRGEYDNRRSEKIW